MVYFTALYKLGGGENGDGEVDERDCGGVVRHGGQGEGGMGGRQACDNGRVRKEVERLYRRRLD